MIDRPRGRRARWLLGGAVAVFGVVLAVVLLEVTLSMDHAVAREATQWTGASEARLRMMRFLSALGSSVVLWPVGAAAVIALIASKRHRAAAWLAIVTLSGSGINSLVKVLTERDRPEVALVEASGLSFPSGHAMNSLIVYGAVLVVALPQLSARTARVALAVSIAVVTVIGFTRVALGLHFFTDVVAGFALGGAWLTAAGMIRPLDGDLRP